MTLEIKTNREIIRWADYLRRNNPVEHLKFLEKSGVSVDSLKRIVTQEINETKNSQFPLLEHYRQGRKAGLCWLLGLLDGKKPLPKAFMENEESK